MLASAAAGPLLLMPLLFAGFGVLKMLLPLYVPFGWDDSFAAADRALFLGHQPWELTHALFGSFSATLAIDRLYTLWVLILSFAILGFALFAPRYDRARFFLSFSAAWVLLGVLGAWLFSSAGPCYAAQIGTHSAHEFAPLMERLQALSGPDGRLGAVGWQDMLWQAHAERRYGFGMGISAMPSLHNAIALLYALALARFGRLWAVAGWSFAAIVFVASVHLGWHYAVDGIVAGAAMAGIWWAAGSLSRAHRLRGRRARRSAGDQATDSRARLGSAQVASFARTVIGAARCLPPSFPPRSARSSISSTWRGSRCSRCRARCSRR